MPLTTDAYNQVVGIQDIELAIISFLREWMPSSIAEIERQSGLSEQTIELPPADESYHAGLDFETYMQGLSPELIVKVTPSGEPERFGDGSYNQLFDVEIAAIIVSADENDGRDLANQYGAAIMLACVKVGTLGKFPNGNPVASDSRLTGYPLPEFIDPDLRTLIRSVVTLQVVVDGVVSESGLPVTPFGIVEPPDNPYAPPGTFPEVDDVTFTVEGVPINGTSWEPFDTGLYPSLTLYPSEDLYPSDGT